MTVTTVTLNASVTPKFSVFEVVAPKKLSSVIFQATTQPTSVIPKTFSVSTKLIAKAFSFSPVTLSIVDSFKRPTEKPVNATNWTEFRVPENINTGSPEINGSEALRTTEDASLGEQGVYWNKEEGNAASVFLKTHPEATNNRASLSVCLAQRAGESGTEHSYYWLALVGEGEGAPKNENEWVLKRKEKAGLTTLITKTKVKTEAKDSFGLTAFQGKVTAWHKSGESGSWEEVMSVEDSTFTSGFSGVGVRGFAVKLQNFAMGMLGQTKLFKEFGVSSTLKAALNPTSVLRRLFTVTTTLIAELKPKATLKSIVQKALAAQLKPAAILTMGSFLRKFTAVLSFKGKFGLNYAQLRAVLATTGNLGLAITHQFKARIAPRVAGILPAVLKATLTFKGSLTKSVSIRLPAAGLTVKATLFSAFDVLLNAALAVKATLFLPQISHRFRATLSFLANVRKRNILQRFFEAGLTFAGALKRPEETPEHVRKHTGRLFRPFEEPSILETRQLSTEPFLVLEDPSPYPELEFQSAKERMKKGLP